MTAKHLALAALLIVCTVAKGAGLEAFQFNENVPEQRFKELLAELRCLVCQNQSLADSDADLAHDLRQEVYELMDEGRTNADIRQYLVARYGDFVLYDPPIKPSTYLLWAAPFVLLLLGFVALLHTLRQRQRQKEPEFSADDERRLKQLLGDASRDHGNST